MKGREMVTLVSMLSACLDEYLYRILLLPRNPLNCPLLLPIQLLPGAVVAEGVDVAKEVLMCSILMCPTVRAPPR